MQASQLANGTTRPRDPDARHGHKTSARGFDGYKGHIAIDPDSEIITNHAVSAANEGDGSVAKMLLEDVLPAVPPETEPSAGTRADEREPMRCSSTADISSSAEGSAPATTTSAEPLEVYGDASYGTGDILEHVEGRAVPNVEVQPPSAPAGHFPKDAFEIDLEHNTVRCPAGVLVQIRPLPSGSIAELGPHCSTCPLRGRCTTSRSGRVIEVNKHERLLQRERARQRDPGWRANYRAIRPKVERKLAHIMRRRHGGRRARMRGRTRIGHDFALLAAATNLQRLAILRARRTP